METRFKLKFFYKTVSVFDNLFSLSLFYPFCFDNITSFNFKISATSVSFVVVVVVVI